MNRFLSGTIAVTILFISGCTTDETNSFAGSGIIEAREITVSAETRGKLVRLAFEEGDYLRKDRIIAEIDVEQSVLQRDAVSKDLVELHWNENIFEKEIILARESVLQASITLENARKTRDRVSNLFNQNAATKEQFDKTETEYALSESRLRTAEKQLAVIETRLASLQAKREKIEANLRLLDRSIDDGKVVCPADGVVLEKYAEQGEIVNFATPLCIIADISTVWLNIYVGEEMLGKLVIGGKADIRVDSHPDVVFEGKITRISQRAEFTPKNVQTKDSRVDLVYAVKITTDNPEGIFKIGMPADVYIEGLQKD